ncbi:copper resistance CopC family protein [Microbacterium sp. USHLN186]|uniref:copper resistance CopC family protein n=1 Tax=Microbacterium sp. USHLN186 TaxID=3081286 RepID=UPI0030179856
MFRTRIRTRIATAVAAAAVAASLAVAAPASAHDTIVSSTPAADAQLTSAPTEVVLTFSNNLLSLDENSGTAMTVTDESGKDWVAGEPEISADTVTVPLAEGMPNGAYRVTWQVVSSDGHPTSGEYGFALAAAPPVETATAQPTETAAPAQTGTPSETATPTATVEADATPWPLLIGLGVVVLVAIVLAVVMAARRRR